MAGAVSSSGWEGTLSATLASFTPPRPRAMAIVSDHTAAGDGMDAEHSTGTLSLALDLTAPIKNRIWATPERRQGFSWGSQLTG